MNSDHESAGSLENIGGDQSDTLGTSKNKDLVRVPTDPKVIELDLSSRSELSIPVPRPSTSQNYQPDASPEDKVQSLKDQLALEEQKLAEMKRQQRPSNTGSKFSDMVLYESKEESLKRKDTGSSYKGNTFGKPEFEEVPEASVEGSESKV